MVTPLARVCGDVPLCQESSALLEVLRGASQGGPDWTAIWRFVCDVLQGHPLQSY